MRREYYKSVADDQLNELENFVATCPLKSIELNGKSYTYLDGGSGDKTLIFCHGAFLDAYSFYKPMLALKSDYRVISVNYDNTHLSVEDNVILIKALTEKESIGQFTLIGYSFGGNTAQLMMKEYPDLLNGVILSNTTNLFKPLSLKKQIQMIAYVYLLPYSSIQKMITTRKDEFKESPYFHMYDAYFKDTYSIFKRNHLRTYFKNTKRLERRVKGYVPTYKGKVGLLVAKDDLGCLEGFHDYKRQYPNHQAYNFQEYGGHHMAFLHPETHTEKLIEMVHLITKEML